MAVHHGGAGLGGFHGGSGDLFRGDRHVGLLAVVSPAPVSAQVMMTSWFMVRFLQA
jgi:hypothetical protein